jgi:hypothetical protein
MAYLVTIDKQSTGELSLISNFSESIVLNNIGEEKIVTINDISGLLTLDILNTTFVGDNNTRKLNMYYRIATSDNPTLWSDWIEIDPNGDSNCFIEVTPFYDYNIQMKFIRTGGNTEGELSISDFIWKGTWNINVIEEPILDLTSGISPVVLDVKDTYKVFEIDGYELVARNANDLTIDYRISQDNKRSWSVWTPLTDANIREHKVDPIRFFNIQYQFTHTGTSGTIKIRDLNFYGSFINITKNYEKAAAVGLREDCKNGVIGNTGLNAGTGTNNLSMGAGLKSPESIWSTLTCSDDDLFNPYNLGEAIDLYEKLADDVTKIGGWTVEYFRTAPDENGIDHTIHEYSLHGVVATGDVKIMVPENQFPSNQTAFNQFDLALLESFEVHLTKQEYKAIFGVQFRPKKEDFLWFCDLSRMYRVEHAQAIRDFGNSSVYYKLILGKYNQRADVKAVNTTIQERISSIVKNSTLEELFGTDMQDHKKEVANKEQHTTLSQTHERIRSTIKATVSKELLDNAELVLSKYHYDLSGIQPGGDAVVYQKSDIYLKAGENRSFIAWFNFSDYTDSDVYNLLDNFSTDLNKGYSFNITGGELITNINGTDYTMDVSNHLDDNIWYCVLVNIDQRQRKFSNYLYKRDVDREIDAGSLKSTKLRLLTSNELPYTPNEYELDEGDLSMKITGSLMKITNIRLFDDVIPVEQHTKILNQQIIRDSDHAILADNANKIYFLDSYPYHGS